MAGTEGAAARAHPAWREARRSRARSVGLWAWLAQRISAVALVLLVAAHLLYPYSVALQFLLLMTVLTHGLLGIRVILLDCGVDVRSHRAILGVAAALGALLLFLLWRAILAG